MFMNIWEISKGDAANSEDRLGLKLTVVKLVQGIGTHLFETPIAEARVLGKKNKKRIVSLSALTRHKDIIQIPWFHLVSAKSLCFGLVLDQ